MSMLSVNNNQMLILKSHSYAFGGRHKLTYKKMYIVYFDLRGKLPMLR
jgi:hypothetical protein